MWLPARSSSSLWNCRSVLGERTERKKNTQYRRNSVRFQFSALESRVNGGKQECGGRTSYTFIRIRFCLRAVNGYDFTAALIFLHHIHVHTHTHTILPTEWKKNWIDANQAREENRTRRAYRSACISARAVFWRFKKILFPGILFPPSSTFKGQSRRRTSGVDTRSINSFKMSISIFSIWPLNGPHWILSFGKNLKSIYIFYYRTYAVQYVLSTTVGMSTSNVHTHLSLR